MLLILFIFYQTFLAEFFLIRRDAPRNPSFPADCFLIRGTPYTSINTSQSQYANQTFLVEFFIFGGRPPEAPFLLRWRRNIVQWTINLFNIWYNDQYFFSCYKNETFIGCNVCKPFGLICECFQQQSEESKNSISRVLAITIQKLIKNTVLLQKHKYRCGLFWRTDGRTDTGNSTLVKNFLRLWKKKPPFGRNKN